MLKKLKASMLPVAVAALFLSVTAAPHASLARDGITACKVAKKGHLWEYRISANVPKDTNCRVYIWQDENGHWVYCWNESVSFVAKRCTDLINDKSFTGWKAKAKCDGKEFIKRCNK
jgi:hypothetical protein